jgi:two-component system, chemotaxis family, protein-glutamate methylesterase/glutaminase
MGRIRVLVVEDSRTVREMIVAALESDARFQVVGEAGDGHAAIRLCEELRPDVLTLDLVIPGPNGLAVTEHVMAECPTPILVVSASANRSEAFDTLDALRAGAVDILDKSLLGSRPGWREELLSCIELVSRIRVVTRRARSRRPAGLDEPKAVAVEPAWPGPATPYRALAIGASTGGPSAVATLLAALPRGFPLPILLVIHLAPLFGQFMADWLAMRTGRRVRLARDAEPLGATGPDAAVLLAPADQHLVLEGGRLHLSSGRERHACRPSVDVLFESIAHELGPHAIGCLLTGMGRDGADGLLAMRRAGARTVVQDEASSVVFGMPREAIEVGAAERVLALDEIATTIDRITGGAERALP